ncbi:MAG: amidohydrolase family protein [Acidimicrobiaceae bacterium]|nr:amidohydrolase family protein [Acidimicrobiaceae bacterium]
MLDLLIRGGTVIDGTGAPAVAADVGIRDGRIVGVGPLDEPARSVLDVTGLVVAPGFVDLHTHYDAQLFWDPTASPSPLHGVTTVFGGNCGFTLAPAGDADRDYLARMMAKVEGMPLPALEQGLPWDWTSFPQWLDRMDRPLGVNAGFLCGHSALRRAALGPDAVGGTASPEQIATMQGLLHDALAAGAMGFSTSTASPHLDGDGQPVPSRAASSAEVLALAEAVADHPGTTLEVILAGCLRGFSEEEIDLLTSMSTLGNRPINWNVLGVSAANRPFCEQQLHASTAAAARGARVVALTLPPGNGLRVTLVSGAPLNGLPGWREVFALPVPSRMQALADPSVRSRLEAGATSDEAGVLRGLAHWPVLTVEETFTDATAAYRGRTVRDVAAAMGVAPFDALLDVALADGLRTGFRYPTMPETDADWALRLEVWRDPRAVIGGSDAGAHLDMMCGATYSTTVLATARTREALTMEEAVRLLSDVPARLYGLRDRGRLEPGCFADLVVFDPETVGPGTESTRDDLPGGASRLYATSRGVEHVLVSGTRVVAEGKLTGATPGSLLRSGRDTDTVSAANKL